MGGPAGRRRLFRRLSAAVKSKVRGVTRMGFASGGTPRGSRLRREYRKNSIAPFGRKAIGGKRLKAICVVPSGWDSPAGAPRPNGVRQRGLPASLSWV